MFDSYLPRTQSPNPVAAIVLYETSNSLNGGFATIHKVTQRADTPGAMIGPGSLASENEIAALCESLKDKTSTSGANTMTVFPKGLLAAGRNSIAWISPGRIRPMWFRLPGGPEIMLQVPWPTLLYLVKDNQMRVAALASSNRRSLHSKLFHAPMMNVNASGQVCLGGVPLPEKVDADHLEAWEKCFTGSWFTHLNATGIVRYGKTIPKTNPLFVKFWRGMKKHKSFPKECLVDMGMIVGDFLKAGAR